MEFLAMIVPVHKEGLRQKHIIADPLSCYEVWVMLITLYSKIVYLYYCTTTYYLGRVAYENAMFVNRSMIKFYGMQVHCKLKC